MSNRVCLRQATPDEEAQIRCLARSQTAVIRHAQRARIIAEMLDDPKLSATEAGRRGWHWPPGRRSSFSLTPSARLKG